MNTPYITFITV